MKQATSAEDAMILVPRVMFMSSGDGVPAPTLYEGAGTLNPAGVVGCTTAYTNDSQSTGGYDC